MTRIPDLLIRTAKQQAGALSRQQCLQAGLTRDQLCGLVDKGRWQRVYRGAFAIHTGPLADETRVWAALLAIDADAAASHETALWLAAPRGKLGPVIHIAVHQNRVVHTPPTGLTVHRLPRQEVLATRPPRLGIERSLLDVIHITLDQRRVIGLVCDTLGTRRTAPHQVLTEMKARPRQRWRSLITDMLQDVGMGAQSPLELADLRNDRRHGLPAGQRQVSRRAGGEGRWLDVVIAIPGSDEHVVKELDGRLGHEGTGKFRDMRRDNHTSLGGGRPLRLGWTDLRITPCEAAAFEALLYQRLGWPGTPRPCGPKCTIVADMVKLDREIPWRTTA